MIIKGKSRGNGAQLGVYLITPGDNERIEVLEIRGLAAEDVPGAVLEMEAHAAGTRCEKPLYHASINPRADERLTDEQLAIALDRLEAKLGFTGQPRVVVLHQKEGRIQYHIVWDRIDLECMRAISDSHNYRKHEEVARELEREFGHKRVQGAHAERDGKPRPNRTPGYSDMEQSKRTGLSPQQVTDEVTSLWRSTDSGKAFAAALADAGYVLARGDRRDFVIVDRKGGIHSLARRIEGVRVKDVRDRMADLDARELPSVAQAKAIQRERQAQQALEEERLRSTREGTAAPEWTEKGGMVEQQHSAIMWVKKSEEERTERAERTDRKQEKRDAEQANEQRLQAYMREFGRGPEEELDAGRERERGRGRGE